MAVPQLSEDSNGEVFIYSGSIYDVDDAFDNYICEMFAKTIPGWWDMEDEEQYALIRKEEETFRSKLPDRSNWEELKRNYMPIMAHLEYHDELAREIGEKTGIKLIYAFSLMVDFSFFYSHFNASGISYEEKMRMIEKTLDAIDLATKEAKYLEGYEKFREFRRLKGYV